jgi:RHS repeat-associated protein
MQGISSTWFKGANYFENKKKYQQYEFNEDLDVNVFESFYRSHDPQTGRFMQLDPKPIFEMEGLYNAMGNNPISNIDILGDITFYYNSEGTLLRSQDDGKEYATITVVADENLNKFYQAEGIIDIINAVSKFLTGENLISDKVVAGLLSTTGISYDTKEFAQFYDRHSKDFYKGEAFEPIDGKGPLVNEYAAGLTLEKGFLKVMDKAPPQPGNNPFISDTDEIGAGGGKDIHTHTSEGRRFEEKSGKTGTVETGKAGLGWDKNRRSWDSRELHKKGILDVVVTPTHVYLYGNCKLPQSSANQFRVNMNEIVNFKFYNHAKKIYGKPDSVCA